MVAFSLRKSFAPHPSGDRQQVTHVIIHFILLFFCFQCSSRRTSTGASPCPSFPNRRSWARQRTAPSRCGLPAACRCHRSPVTSPPSPVTPHRSPTPLPKTTAALRARGVMRTSRCCPSWQTLTAWRQKSSTAVCVASRTPRILDCSSINSCTATLRRGNPSVVNIARRSTWAWELSKCTSGLTPCRVFVKSAGKPSPDHGCSKDTSGRTPVSEWEISQGAFWAKRLSVVVGFCRHRLIMFNPVHDLIAFTAASDPVTQLSTVSDRLILLRKIGNLRMLLLPVQLLFLVCWKERKNIAFADKCHVIMNQQQDLLSAVLVFKTLCCNQPKNNRPLWSHFYTNLSVHPLWQCLLSHFSPDRREAVLLPPLQQGFRRQVQSQGSPTDPFGCEKIPMQELLQNLLQNVSSAQAWGIWLLCSTLNWDTFPPPEQEKKTVSASSFFLPNPGELSGNHMEGVCFQDFLFYFQRPISFQSET